MKHVVAVVDEIPSGSRKIVDVAGRSIGVFNLNGEYFALRNRCPHQGGALCEGQLWGVLNAERPGEYEYEASREILACPWHGWEFHVRTGQSWCDPEKLRVRSYEVSVVEGEELEAQAPSVQEGPPKEGPPKEGPPKEGPPKEGPPKEGPPKEGMVKGPYVAETYPVTREGAYLVVELPS